MTFLVPYGLQPLNNSDLENNIGFLANTLNLTDFTRRAFENLGLGDAFDKFGIDTLTAAVDNNESVNLDKWWQKAQPTALKEIPGKALLQVFEGSQGTLSLLGKIGHTVATYNMKIQPIFRYLHAFVKRHIEESVSSLRRMTLTELFTGMAQALHPSQTIRETTEDLLATFRIIRDTTRANQPKNQKGLFRKFGLTLPTFEEESTTVTHLVWRLNLLQSREIALSAKVLKKTWHFRLNPALRLHILFHYLRIFHSFPPRDKYKVEILSNLTGKSNWMWAQLCGIYANLSIYLPQNTFCLVLDYFPFPSFQFSLTSSVMTQLLKETWTGVQREKRDLLIQHMYSLDLGNLLTLQNFYVLTDKYKFLILLSDMEYSFSDGPGPLQSSTQKVKSKVVQSSSFQCFIEVAISILVYFEKQIVNYSSCNSLQEYNFTSLQRNSHSFEFDQSFCQKDILFCKCHLLVMAKAGSFVKARITNYMFSGDQGATCEYGGIVFYALLQFNALEDINTICTIRWKNTKHLKNVYSVGNKMIVLAFSFKLWSLLNAEVIFSETSCLVVQVSPCFVRQDLNVAKGMHLTGCFSGQQPKVKGWGSCYHQPHLSVTLTRYYSCTVVQISKQNVISSLFSLPAEAEMFVNNFCELQLDIRVDPGAETTLRKYTTYAQLANHYYQDQNLSSVKMSEYFQLRSVFPWEDLNASYSLANTDGGALFHNETTFRVITEKGKHTIGETLSQSPAVFSMFSTENKRNSTERNSSVLLCLTASLDLAFVDSQHTLVFGMKLFGIESWVEIYAESSNVAHAPVASYSLPSIYYCSDVLPEVITTEVVVLHFGSESTGQKHAAEVKVKTKVKFVPMHKAFFRRAVFVFPQ